jgi:hypothetical protein
MTTLDEFSGDSGGLLGGTDERYYEDADSESGFDEAGEDDYSESRQSRQERARLIAANRRKRQLNRMKAGRKEVARTPAPAAPIPVAAEVRRTQAAVREVGLETQVQADAIGSAMTAQSRRIGGTENALTAGIVVGAAQSLFGTSKVLDNPVAKLGLPLAPLLFVRRPKGAAVWTNPQVLAPVAVAGLFLGKELLGSFGTREVADVDIRQAPTQLVAGQRFVLKAVATDRRGDIISDIVPTLTLTGATEDPAGSSIYKVAADTTEVSVIAAAGNKKAPLIIPVGRTEIR